MPTASPRPAAGWPAWPTPIAAEDGLVGEGWGAVVKVLRTAETSAPLDGRCECAGGVSPGYVWLNTPALMKGYFQRDDLTENAVIDGWF
jgi:long-subunit acyl-CoA synthetase (AMP-forming)